jgi:hypothetical protein
MNTPGIAYVAPAVLRRLRFTLTEVRRTFSLVKRRHKVKFGTDIRREALDNLTPPNPTGFYAFTTTGTNLSASRGAVAPLPRCYWGK